MVSTSNKTDSNFELFKTDVHVIYCILMAITGVFIVFVDGILLVAIKKDPYRAFFNKPSIYMETTFLWNSLFGGIIIVPMIITFELHRDDLSEQYDSIFKFILSFLTRVFIANGTLTCSLSAFEGILGLAKPHVVRRLATKKNIKRILVFCILVSLGYCLLPLSGAGSYELYTMIHVHLFVLIPLISLTCLIGYVYYRVRHPTSVGHQNRIDSSTTRRQEENRSKRNKQIARNYIAASLYFLFPFTVFALSYYFSKMFHFDYFSDGCEMNRWCFVAGRLVVFLAFLFPVSNTIVLIFMIPIYKRSVSYYICCRKERPT